MLKTYGINTQSAKQITLISLIALVLGHLMMNLYIPNEGLNLVGLLLVSYFIFYNTLRKNDIFSFLMVIYFCSTFPFLPAKGGAFNMVSVVCIGLYHISTKKLPLEKPCKDIWFKLFLCLFILSSILGWIFNYTGKGLDYLYSILTFSGIILLLIISSSIEITNKRLKVFLKLNFILIIYSTIATINKYLGIITFETPMMPIYGWDEGFIEGGGIVGSSPLYGEHSLLLLILFATFLFLGNKKYGSIQFFVFGFLISYINVFMSISRSVFLLSIAGIVLLLFFQFKIKSIDLIKQITQILLVALLGFGILFIVNYAGLGYVFKRVEEIDERNEKAGGVTIDRLIDGSAFNRVDAFREGYKRYHSKNSWIIGHGWGITANNRDAFYVDTSIKRGTAHSQLFAMLFLFGWIGFVAYFILIFRIIIKSYMVSGDKRKTFDQRIIAFFFMTAFILFLFNEIKVDSVSYPYYFAITFIWMGLAHSSFSSLRKLKPKTHKYNFNQLNHQD